jgi:outer membrane protein assembly factor BamB
MDKDSAGNIYVEDVYDEGRIQNFNRNGNFIRSIPLGIYNINGAQIAVRNQNILVSASNKIYCFDLSGQFLFQSEIISNLNRALFLPNGQIIAAKWTGAIVSISRK